MTAVSSSSAGDMAVQEAAAMALARPTTTTSSSNQNDALRHVSTGSSTHTTSSSNQLPVTAEDDDEEAGLEEERLSADLVQFLSNPSLKAALADGSLDLTSYSSTVESELHDLESQCIRVYRNHAEEIRSLREDLESCDAVLAALQEMLLGFQADLGGLSGDIRNLQDKSRSLGIQLRNRRRAEEGLREFLEHVVIAPALVHTICRGAVNEVFLEAVQELNRIYVDIHDETPQEWSCGEAPARTVSAREMQDHVHKLRLVAVGRTRNYFLNEMALLRRPQTNIRMIQIHALLKYSELQDFLEEGSPEIANEIFNVYVESMGKTLYALFRTYQAQLHQLDSTKTAATRQDVIAIDDAMLRDVLTSKAKKRVDSFTLGNRATTVLEMTHSRPILAHVALAEKQKYPYEMIFRSILMHLMDAVTNEHIFSRQFFKRDAFHPLFRGTLGLLLEQLENYLFSCHDALALLLMIKVVHQHRRMLEARYIESLHPFLDKMTKLLWPRLKMVMDAHLRSIKGANAQKLGGVELHAHYVSRRYAEFTCSILMILHKGNQDKREGGSAAPAAGGGKPRRGMEDDVVEVPVLKRSPSSASQSDIVKQKMSAGDMLLNDLATIQEETVVLLERLADKHASNKKRIVFLINNLDQIVCIFQERRVVGREFNRFVELLMTQRELFVEEELLHSFSKLIAFVQQTEQALVLGKARDVNANVVEALIREFAQTWRSAIEQINRNVLSYFSNFRNGMEILKQVLTQLLLYYTRFQKIIHSVWRNKTPPFCRDLVNTSVILAEIKKYALAI